MSSEVPLVPVNGIEPLFKAWVLRSTINYTGNTRTLPKSTYSDNLILRYKPARLYLPEDYSWKPTCSS